MELPQSKYLKYFQDNIGGITEASQLTGDILLVEKIKFPERRVGGIILDTGMGRNQVTGFSSNVPLFFRVLHTGAGFYNDDTGEDVPLDIERGDIVLCASVSVNVFSSFPMLETSDSDVIGLTRHSEVQWRFRGEKAFLDFLAGLNGSMKEVMNAKT
jgi:hypothetical protein